MFRLSMALRINQKHILALFGGITQCYSQLNTQEMRRILR